MDKKKIIFFCVLFFVFILIPLFLSLRRLVSSEYYIQNDNDDDISQIIEKFLSHYSNIQHPSILPPSTKRSYVLIDVVRINTEMTRIRFRLRDARILGFQTKTPVEFVLSYLPTKKIVYIDDFETTSPLLSQQIEDSRVFDCPLFFLA